MPTVLIVEDDPLIGFSAFEIFERRGWDALHARNGVEAMALLQAHPEVALVFSDVTMPGAVDGSALARLLAQLRPDLRVILTSGYGRPDLPGAEFVAKPWTERTLFAVIDPPGSLPLATAAVPARYDAADYRNEARRVRAAAASLRNPSSRSVLETTAQLLDELALAAERLFGIREAEP
jgi:CheY-like chemotaxis protein